MSAYDVGQKAVDAFLARSKITGEEDLKEFLQQCEDNEGEWQVLSAHSSLNAARTKVTKIRQGYMANTLRAAREAGNIEMGVSNNDTLGPVVLAKWVVG